MADEEEVKEPETKSEPAPEPKPATAAEIASAVAAAITTKTNPEQAEAEWQRLEAETGFTRQQLQSQERLRREANLRDNLPLYEKVGEVAAKEILDNDPQLVQEVKDMLAKHPELVRANEQAWKDAAFIVLGKAQKSGKFKVKESEAKEPVADKGKVMGGKVNTGLTEGGRGTSPKPKPKEYGEFEQHIINRNFNGNAEEYEKYKSRETTKPRAVEISGTNRADLEMARLTGSARV